MVKIKKKKQLNLPQLIEWAMDNNVDNNIFVGKKNLYNVGFNKNGLMYFNTTKPIPTGEIFTIEVEEEITEETKLDKAVEVYSNEFDNCYTVFWRENSVKNILATNIDNIEYKKTETIHIINDDGTHTLIWRDGKLVE